MDIKTKLTEEEKNLLTKRDKELKKVLEERKKLKKLKKEIKKRKSRIRILTFKVNIKEEILIKNKALKKNISLSEFIRNKILK